MKDRLLDSGVGQSVLLLDNARLHAKLLLFSPIHDTFITKV